MDNVTIITNNPSQKQKLKELWRYKEVFYFLSWKDIIVRYKQTVLGVLWAIIQPVFSMVVMTFIFGNLAKLPSNGAPYPIMVYSAMLSWNFLSSSLSSVSNSLVSNSNLINKIYFPRIALPISSIITAFVDFIISFMIFVIIMIGYKYMPSIKILFIPLFVILTFVIALGLGLFFATMNVKYRDIRYIVPMILQFGLYLSPVGYASSIIPAKIRLIYSLNPMVGIIEGFRWCIIPGTQIYIPALITSITIAVISIILGIKFFVKFESTFADII